MRLFVAIELDDAARAAIASEQRRLRTALRHAGDLRWTDPSQMHLTLAFLGEIEERVAGDLIAALSQPVEIAPFQLTFGGLGVFPSQGAPRVLWIGAERGVEHARQLNAVVATRISGCGVPLERRPFHAHLTLARWRDRPPRSRSARPFGLRQPTGEVASVDVVEAVLFRSRLSPQGSTYTALARALLVATPPLQ